MTDIPMMACGCAAQAVRTMTGGITHDPIPVCSIHDCTEIVTTPDLTGREAKCGCGQIRPSDKTKLAFFEYLGPGSREARELCGNCGYTESAHEKPHVAAKCQNFVPRGPRQYDRFYCGCRGVGLMLNTQENREAFVAEFSRSTGKRVSERTAEIVLGALDGLPEHYGKWKNLWTRIMQDDATSMLGEPYVQAVRDQGKRVTHARYDRIGKQVTDAIYKFCEGRN